MLTELFFQLFLFNSVDFTINENLIKSTFRSFFFRNTVEGSFQCIFTDCTSTVIHKYPRNCSKMLELFLYPVHDILPVTSDRAVIRFSRSFMNRMCYRNLPIGFWYVVFPLYDVAFLWHLDDRDLIFSVKITTVNRSINCIEAYNIRWFF